MCVFLVCVHVFVHTWHCSFSKSSADMNVAFLLNLNDPGLRFPPSRLRTEVVLGNLVGQVSHAHGVAPFIIIPHKYLDHRSLYNHS